MKKTMYLISFMILSSVMMTACNTIAGAGQDISHAGHVITGESDEHK